MSIIKQLSAICDGDSPDDCHLPLTIGDVREILGHIQRLKSIIDPFAEAGGKALITKTMIETVNRDLKRGGAININSLSDQIALTVARNHIAMKDFENAYSILYDEH